MSSAIPDVSPRTTRLHIAATAVIAGVQALAYGLGGSSLGDTDPFRHLQYAHQLWLSGFTLRGHPFLPFTILGRSGVDLWWGFHLFLVPFTAAGIVWGARLAGATIAALSMGGTAWVMARLGQRKPALFALLPALTSADFAYRAHVARPAYLTVPLVLLALAAGAGKVRPRWAALGGFVHGAIHLSSPLSPVFAALGAIAQGPREWRSSLRAVLASAGGLALCLTVRPDRASYLQTAWMLSIQSQGHGPDGRLPTSGGEGATPSLEVWLTALGCTLLVLAIAMVLGRGRRRAGEGAPLRAALLAATFTLFLSLRTLKFFDDALPCTALAAALAWPLGGWVLNRGARAALAAVGGLLGAHALVAIPRAWVAELRQWAPPEFYAHFAQQVRAQVPPGSMIFVDDWGGASILYGFLPEYRFPVAYDPSMLYGASPERFWIWEHASLDGMYCPQRDAEACPGAVRGPEGAAKAIASFGAEWVVTRKFPAGNNLRTVAQAAPDQFELRFRESSPGEDFVLWHLRPAP